MAILEGKRIVITGASQGLGRELALQLAGKGAELILIARTESLLRELQAQIIQANNGKAEYFVCDICRIEEVQRTTDDILKKFGSIDILINNAGIWTDDELQKDQPERIQQALLTNAAGHIQFSEQLLSHFKQKNAGTILNVISTAGVPDIPAGNNTQWKAYGASKWAIAGYSQALRNDLQGTRIKVIQFFPGGFESNLYQNAGRANAHNQPWMMKTEDVAEVIVFALSRPADMNVDKIVISKISEA